MKKHLHQQEIKRMSFLRRKISNSPDDEKTMGNEIKRNFVITSIIKNYANKNFGYSMLYAIDFGTPKTKRYNKEQ